MIILRNIFPLQVDSSPDTEDDVPLEVEDDMEQDYQEIDDNHQSKYEPKRHGPPQIRIERKQFQQHSNSMVSSVGSEEMLDRGMDRSINNGYSSINTQHAGTPSPPRMVKKSHDNIPRSHDHIPRSHDHIPRSHETNIPSRTHDHIPRSHEIGSGIGPPRMKERPKGSQGRSVNGPKIPTKPVYSPPGTMPHSQIPIAHFHKQSDSKSDRDSPVTLTPKNPPTPLSSHLPNAPPNTAQSTHSVSHSQHFFPSSSPASTSHTVSALATLPRHHRHYQSSSQDARPTKPIPENEPQTLDRRVLYKQGGYESRTVPGERRVKPPTPPLRKLPSLESRIYAVANVGLKLPDSGNLANRGTCESQCTKLHASNQIGNYCYIVRAQGISL